MKAALIPALILLLSPIGAVADTQRDVPVAERGLERFFEAGSVDSAFRTFTAGIEAAGHAVDTYRAQRALTREDALIPASTDDAGITQDQIEAAEGDMGQKLTLGVRALGSHLWTFALWLLSNLFARPLLLEVALFLGVGYLIFRALTRRGKRTPLGL